MFSKKDFWADRGLRRQQFGNSPFFFFKNLFLSSFSKTFSNHLFFRNIFFSFLETFPNLHFWWKGFYLFQSIVFFQNLFCLIVFCSFRDGLSTRVVKLDKNFFFLMVDLMIEVFRFIFPHENLFTDHPLHYWSWNFQFNTSNFGLPLLKKE